MKPELNQTQAIYPLEDPKPKVCVTTTIAFLATAGRSYGTIKNHISSVKHFHRLFGHPPWWDNSYAFQLGLHRCKRFLGMIPARKLPINPSLLLRMAPLFDNSSPALFMLLCMLYSSLHFSFLCKSNLVVQTPSMTSLKVPRRLDLHVSPNGAFFQWALSIPVAIILGSPLCPVTALINHLCLKLVGPSDCLFSVRSPSTQSTQHITYHFSKFLAKVVTALGLDTCLFPTYFSLWQRFDSLCM